MVSKFQWKPFWLATQRDPQNDWTATQNGVNYDVFAQAPLCCWWTCGFAWWLWFPRKNHHWNCYINFERAEQKGKERAMDGLTPGSFPYAVEKSLFISSNFCTVYQNIFTAPFWRQDRRKKSSSLFISFFISCTCWACCLLKILPCC